MVFILEIPINYPPSPFKRKSLKTIDISGFHFCFSRLNLVKRYLSGGRCKNLHRLKREMPRKN